ncbi:hypothetical protein [Rhizobium sp. A37_96]
MINTDSPDRDPDVHDAKVDHIVASGPRGAIVVAGIATACVVAMWLLFYLFVFLPRTGFP